jgi:hypothetical protein
MVDDAPCTATKAAAATSARSMPLRKAKPSATTKTCAYVAAWEYPGDNVAEALHKEKLDVKT